VDFPRLHSRHAQARLVGIVGAVVLLGDDMLDVKTEKRLVGFMQPAILAALAGERMSERIVSCPVAFAGQENAGFGLEDGDEVVGPQVQLVLTAFLGRQLALVAFVGQLGDACLRFAVGLQIEEFLRCLLVEGGADGFKNPI
jgi:hypothetical protein